MSCAAVKQASQDLQSIFRAVFFLGSMPLKSDEYFLKRL